MRRTLGALAACAVLASGCGGAEEPSDDRDNDSTAGLDEVAATVSLEPTPTPIIDAGPKATYTGLPAPEELAEQPVVVVKVSNNDDRSLAALIGLESADVVIEERIEDRATRFAAIFHSEIPAVLGPVRSARTTDGDLLVNLGEPILVFSGANIGVLGELRALSAEDHVVLVLDTGSNQHHYRDQDFRAPDNLFTDLRQVIDDFSDAAGAAQPIFTFRDEESGPRPPSIDGLGFTVTGRDTVSYVYRDRTGYVRVQDGAIHVTREGISLDTTNLVVMEVPYRPNAHTAGSVDAVTVGEGPVNVLIGGRRWSGTWTRADRFAPYVFRSDDGAEIMLEPGRTWLTLVPQESYTFEVESNISHLVLGAGG